MDFLKQRLFDKIGIGKAWTTCDPCGNACAGWGMSMTTREISLIGQLYLNGGVWNGERLLSDDWVRMATSKQTWSGKTPEEFQPENDWLQGFGFNWWRCQHGCFRADGSGGQYTIVFPQFDAVLSLHADVRNMQEVLDVVWARLLPVFSAGALPEDSVAARTLRERCGALALPPVGGRREGAYEKCLGRRFDFSKAPTGIRGVRLDAVAGGWRLRLSTDAGEQDLSVGFGEWKSGEAKFSTRRHQPLGELVGVQRVASSGAVQGDGSILVKVHVLGGPRRIELRFGHKFFLPYVEGCMVGAATFTSGLL